MSDLNILFQEAYKRLDKVCREMYHSDKGITSYIDDMKNVPTYESACVPGWDKDINRLKKLRGLRNQLAHDVGTLDSCLCTQADIDWLEGFYRRILNQTDPVVVLYRMRKDRQASWKPLPETAETANESFSGGPRVQKSGCLITLVFFTFLTLTAVLTIGIRARRVRILLYAESDYPVDGCTASFGAVG